MLVIDRIEGEYAVADNDGECIDIELCRIVGGCREGDVLVAFGDGFVVDRAETKKRRDEAFSLLESLMKKED